MVQRLIKEEDGYTLVEVLVAITIISIVLGIFYGICFCKPAAKPLVFGCSLL